MIENSAEHVLLGIKPPRQPMVIILILCPYVLVGADDWLSSVAFNLERF
jgi:hypothetical protein